MYDLSMQSSLLYDEAKEAVAKALGSISPHEIVFTYNATYAYNLVSRALVKSELLKAGDRVVLSKMEHHANIVPWHILAEEYGIVVDFVDVHPDGTLDYSSLERLVSGATVISLS